MLQTDTQEQGEFGCTLKAEASQKHSCTVPEARQAPGLAGGEGWELQRFICSVSRWAALWAVRQAGGEL